jgi:hypothetical protein
MGTTELIRTPVGVLHHGDEFFFRRTPRVGREQTGWVTARSLHTTKDEEPLVNGTDRRGLARTIRLTEITRIRKPRRR